MLLPLYLSVVKNNKKNRVSWAHAQAKQYTSNYVSNKYSNPPSALKQYPVIICIHGFGSSPFEWEEFASYAQENECLVSNIFLGNHKSLKEFANSSWQSWLNSVKKEYLRLTKIGFENISICASSTGATLVLHALNNKVFQPSLPLKHVIMVDPLVDINEKLIYKLPYIKNIIFDIPVPTKSKEKGNWIPKRPVNTVIQLLDLISKTKHLLNSKLTALSHVKITIYNSTNDPVINHNSADTIVNAFKQNYVAKIDHYKMDSDLHVFSRLKGRDNIQIKDIKNQKMFFDNVIAGIKK
jgi:carboxylesterase